MNDWIWIKERESRLREFFGLAPETELIAPEAIAAFEVSAPIAAHLARFNIEWHIIPSEAAVHIDTDDYRARLYPMLMQDLKGHEYRKTSSYNAIMDGHRLHQGRIVGVETTPKPRYLPGNRQFYGTPYGFEPAADPFAPYLERAGLISDTRYGHNYAALRGFVNLVTDDWKARSLMPAGYRLTICPPVLFNLIGAVFHREWSMTESRELGFYRDEDGSAKCYAVGSNAPGDFSFIHEIETDSDWALLGFRTALVPA
ncbi:MAG: hypothetical protein ACKVX9_22345 [Blastocatellia bacterium]